MLAAVEAWVKRDHKAEMAEWLSWMNHISSKVSTVETVQASVREPRGLSNHSPTLSIRWDESKLNITGEDVARILDTTEPRIALGGSRGSSISITAYMMIPGEDKIVASRLVEILSARRPSKPAPKPPSGDLTGRWDVRIEYAAGSSNHVFYVKQQGSQLVGTHQGDFVSRDFSGTIAANEVSIASSVGEEHGAALSFRFTGTLNGDTMAGDLDMGEYLGAKWSAKRHEFQV